jgi:hypothetical protein
MNAPRTDRPLGAVCGAVGRYSTHVVTNQAAPATCFNAFDGDMVLRTAAAREALWAAARCSALGKLAGDATVQELARLANYHVPELRTHDRYGNRIDWVEFHPAWHELPCCRNSPAATVHGRSLRKSVQWASCRLSTVPSSIRLSARVPGSSWAPAQGSLTWSANFLGRP